MIKHGCLAWRNWEGRVERGASPRVSPFGIQINSDMPPCVQRPYEDYFVSVWVPDMEPDQPSGSWFWPLLSIAVSVFAALFILWWCLVGYLERCV